MSRILIRLLMVFLVCGVVSLPTFAAEAAHAEEGGHHGASLPMNWQADLALFSLITFGVYIVTLKAGAWGPLQEGLNERERGIRQNIADAEANRLKSESML